MVKLTSKQHAKNMHIIWKQFIQHEFNTITYYDKLKEERKGTPNARAKRKRTALFCRALKVC